MSNSASIINFKITARKSTNQFKFLIKINQLLAHFIVIIIAGKHLYIYSNDQPIVGSDTILAFGPTNNQLLGQHKQGGQTHSLSAKARKS